MTEQGFKRKLAAILSADVEGYSRLMDDDEEATVRTLTSYRTVIADLTQQFRGRVVDSPGDNILADFTSVVDAVNCAVEIQRDLAERNTELPYNRQMQFRIGVNLGDVIEEDGRIYGDGVNIAARVESMAEAGGICISGRAYDQVANKLGLEYENLGEHQVKNISTPIRVYRVLSFPGAAAHRVVQAKEAVSKKLRNLSIVAGAVVVVVAVAVGIWQFYMRRPSIEPASVDRMAFPLPKKPSIAVLPFDNLSGDTEQEYFADGLTEQIITGLGTIPHLFVIARNSTFVYKGKSVKIRQVAEELGVRYVLEGSVQIAGDTLRITVQLIDAISGYHAWAEHYDRNLKDIFELQDEITRKIITSLQIQLTEGEYARLVGRTTSNLKALEYFWRAEHYVLRSNKEDNDLARQWIEKAIEFDPKFATAWALLGWIVHRGFKWGWGESSLQSVDRAEEYAQKAIALDNSNSKAYGLLSDIRLYQQDYDKAVEYGMKAVTLSPSDPHWHATLANKLNYAGNHEEAYPQIKTAMRLSPFPPAYFFDFLIMACFLTRRYDEGISAAEQLLEFCQKGEYPSYAVNFYLAPIYSELGQDEMARSNVAELLRLYPNYRLENIPRGLPFKNKSDLERFLSAFKKAGLK